MGLVSLSCALPFVDACLVILVVALLFVGCGFGVYCLLSYVLLIICVIYCLILFSCGFCLICVHEVCLL